MLEDDYFGEKEVIYLSPDAEEELHEFSKDKVYVIGGLVDGTINNNRTVYKANLLKVKSMKLPLEELRKKIPFRPCLNINTVFYIIDDYFRLGSMEEAIIENLPDRFKTGMTRKVKRDAKKKLEKEKENENENK